MSSVAVYTVQYIHIHMHAYKHKPLHYTPLPCIHYITCPYSIHAVTFVLFFTCYMNYILHYIHSIYYYTTYHCTLHTALHMTLCVYLYMGSVNHLAKHLDDRGEHCHEDTTTELQQGGGHHQTHQSVSIRQQPVFRRRFGMALGTALKLEEKHDFTYFNQTWFSLIQLLNSKNIFCNSSSLVTWRAKGSPL